ncbi:MAG: glycosyltransferase [Alphaproteobacteria bacterium]|nr:MAG: glycosyltransferase [Alphaproteobacteria bacterium]
MNGSPALTTADAPVAAAVEPGRRGRLLFVVHQFFPQFHSGTETLCERVARICTAAGWHVDIITSVMVDAAAIAAFRDSPFCDDAAREILSDERPELSRQFSYDYAPGIRVHAFTHSHDPAYGRPRFGREVSDPAIERFVEALLDAADYHRAAVFHQLHFPLAALETIRERGVPLSFVATDFFAVCPLGSQQLEDGRHCAGQGPGSIACIRHLSDRTGWLEWFIQNYPGILIAPYLHLYRALGPWPKLPVHPHQNLYYLLRRNRDSLRFLKSCDVIVAPTSSVAESLRGAGVPDHRITHLAYGMPPASIPAPPVRRAGSPVRLCYAGQTTERKGLHVLLEALRRLPEDCDWTLDVWGNFDHGGAYARACRAEAEAMAPRVALKGTFQSYRIHEVLDGYDYLVIPSTWAENLPLVLLSALQIALPVIVSDAQGLLDAFPDGRVHGRSFRMGDAEDLARVLREEMRIRPEYRAELAPVIPSVQDFAAALLNIPDLSLVGEG